MLTEGTVQSVTKSVAGSELASGASAGATSITVVDIDEFDPDGGTLTVGDVAGEGGEQHDYTVPDEFGTTLTLATALSSSHSAGERVDLYPLAVEWWADILEPDGQEPLTARIPHSLVPMLATGVRTPTTAEKVEADFAGVDLLVTDVVQQVPNVNGTFIKANTITGAHIKAGSLDGFVITGAVIRTAASGERVTMDSTNGLRLLDSSGSVLVKMPLDGSDAVFTGNIQAAGIDFLEDSAGTPGIDSSVRWLLSGSMRAYVGATNAGGIHTLLHEATTGSRYVDLAQWAGATNGNTKLLVDAFGAVRTIIDANGLSNFLQTPGVGLGGRTAYGVATLVYPGGQSFKLGTVSHGLGTTPTIVVATSDGGIHKASVSSFGSTTFGVAVTTTDGSNPPNGTSVNVSWFAVE